MLWLEHGEPQFDVFHIGPKMAVAGEIMDRIVQRLHGGFDLDVTIEPFLDQDSPCAADECEGREFSSSRMPQSSTPTPCNAGHAQRALGGSRYPITKQVVQYAFVNLCRQVVDVCSRRIL